MKLTDFATPILSQPLHLCKLPTYNFHAILQTSGGHSPFLLKIKSETIKRGNSEIDNYEYMVLSFDPLFVRDTVLLFILWREM